MKNKGFLLVGILVFGSIALLLIGAIIGAAVSNIKLSATLYDRERAFHISEAGVEYYRWHLAHSQSDYQDGNGSSSPFYIHPFYDKTGAQIGQFSLTITPPPVGSTVVKIQSTGNVVTSSTTRKILTTLAIPSLAKYAVVANDVMRFGAGTEIFGPIHSNNGIRFDGIAHNIVTSAISSYFDPDHSGGPEFAVHTHVNPPPGSGTNDAFRPLEAPPNPLQTRTDVFLAGRQFPVPAFDFTGITTDLASIKSQAQSAGKYFGASGSQGYHIVLKTNDTFDIYKVTSLTTAASNCKNTANQTGWGTWSIKSSGGETFLSNNPIPANGLIFVEDNLWVSGQINSARVTIAAGRFPDNPNTRPSITVNNSLTYTNFDGSDVIALISQQDFNVGMVSDDNLTIDAAIIAQNGRAGRYYYPNGCTPYDVRSVLTLYGMIATNLRYGFAYTDGTGYLTRNINYDSNLLYGPPPSFPLTSSQYTTISWEELK